MNLDAHQMMPESEIDRAEAMAEEGAETGIESERRNCRLILRLIVIFRDMRQRRNEALQVSARAQMKIVEQEKKIEMFRATFKRMAEDYDHDNDAHKYDNGSCRACLAEEALKD